VAVRRFETPPGRHYGESGVMVRTAAAIGNRRGRGGSRTGA